MSGIKRFGLVRFYSVMDSCGAVEQSGGDTQWSTQTKQQRSLVAPGHHTYGPARMVAVRSCIGKQFERMVASGKPRKKVDGRQPALTARSPAGRSRLGRGRQPAMVRTHSRACALSVMPGNSCRSSRAAENSPRCS